MERKATHSDDILAHLAFWYKHWIGMYYLFSHLKRQHNHIPFYHGGMIRSCDTVVLFLPFFVAQSHTRKISPPQSGCQSEVCLKVFLKASLSCGSTQSSGVDLRPPDRLPNKRVAMHLWDWKGTSPYPETRRNVAASMLESCATVKHIKSWYAQLLQ